MHCEPFSRCIERISEIANAAKQPIGNQSSRTHITCRYRCVKLSPVVSQRGHELEVVGGRDHGRSNADRQARHQLAGDGLCGAEGTLSTSCAIHGGRDVEHNQSVFHVLLV